MENKESIHDWSAIKEKLKKEFPQLTEDDLMYETGKEEELLKSLQEKLNKNRHEIRKWLHMMG